MDFIDEIERSLELAAQRRYVAIQPGDSPITFADTTLLETLSAYRPARRRPWTSRRFATGIENTTRPHESSLDCSMCT
jgi:hypothetical protein